MSDEPLDLDKHRGMAAQKATEIRRAMTDVEGRARELRERQSVLESRLMSVAATSWPEAAAKASNAASCSAVTALSRFCRK